tara:strand:+ start:363 stop:668 length:306 start_codon:yes stop_codon:yes gene_type:complete
MEVCTAELRPVTQTSELLTTMDGAEAVLGALSITVFPLVLLLTVLLAVVLLTVFEEELTVLEEELTVLLAVVLVTVSTDHAGFVKERTNTATSPINLDITK